MSHSSRYSKGLRNRLGLLLVVLLISRLAQIVGTGCFKRLLSFYV